MQLNLGLDNTPSSATASSETLSAERVLEWLRACQETGWLRLLDLQFARFLHAEKPDATGLTLLAAALASHQLGRGHVCLDLAAALAGPQRTLNLPPDETDQERSGGGMDTDQKRPLPPAQLLKRISLQDWEVAFQVDMVSDGRRVTPLVYQNGRVYLYRYWRYEQQVAAGVALRLDAAAQLSPPPVARVRNLLDALFGPPKAGSNTDWQRLACALAARQRFAIITGGPGTGKTTTVVRLLALLQALHLETRPNSHTAQSVSHWQPLRIRLAAPTGKAAARLGESIAAKLGELPLEQLGGQEVVAGIPSRVVTLHRLLGSRRNVRRRTYNADNPLPLDLVVVDEASMVSLSDMADLVAALPSEARLVLIGDKDQLSSVEAGSVLGELCSRAMEGHYLPDVAAWLSEATGQRVPEDKQDAHGLKLDQAVAMLRFSHRFDSSSGIGRIALAVNEGKPAEVEALLHGSMPDLAYLQLDAPQGDAYAKLLIEGDVKPEIGKTLKGQRRQGYGHYLAILATEPQSADGDAYDGWAAEVLRAQRSFQLLCVLRNGAWGVTGLNQSIASVLYARGLIPATSGWYAGRPVMVTRNNPVLRLTNGDIGVVLPYPAGVGGGKALRVAFPAEDGQGVRWFAPNRLDDVETVYALTVHKSQGSEFNHVALVLPETNSPVLTRELLYTGITRASHWFTLVNPGCAKRIETAVEQRIYRSSGLADLLAAMG